MRNNIITLVFQEGSSHSVNGLGDGGTENKDKKINSIGENGYNITNIQASHDEGLKWGSMEVESREGIWVKC